MSVSDGKRVIEFSPNDSLPPDGGVFKAYDTGVSWQTEEDTND